MDKSPSIFGKTERVPASVVSAISEYSTSIIADVAGRRGALNGRIKPLAESMRFAGVALTVEVRPGDNLMIHAAIAIAKPGDVIVVDGKGDLTSALIGEIMSQQCVAAGVVGVVVDGAVRDSDAIRDMGFPMFAAGLNPNGPTRTSAGRINRPVSVGGVTVHPGDLVMGDADGVVVVERVMAPSLLTLAEAKAKDEQARIAVIKSNPAFVASWLDEALQTAGVLGAGRSILEPNPHPLAAAKPLATLADSKGEST